jgi:hypothetical protein
MAQAPQIFAKSPDAPAGGGVAVTPSDTVSVATPFRALWVGVTGDVAVLMLGGNVLTFLNVPSGSILPASGSRVNATGTTATSILALW